jgi:DNA-binding transcriptional LysR family regulator
MDSRFLETFVTVVELGSIAAAGRRLNLTPAAIVKRVHTLEDEIGGQLISRSGRNVGPTAGGVAILERARALLSEVRDLGALVKDNIPAGELRLGAISSAVSGILPDALSLLTKIHPLVEVPILPGTSEDLYHKVLDGFVDAAIITKPPFTLPKTCNWQTLRKEPLIVLAHASKSGCEAHAVLASEPFVRYERNRWGGRLVDEYLRRAHIRTKDRYELHALDAIAVLVDRGLGAALVPDWAPPWPEGLSLAKLPLPNPIHSRNVGCLWSRTSVRARLVHIFLDVASKSALASQSSARRKRPVGRPR